MIPPLDFYMYMFSFSLQLALLYMFFFSIVSLCLLLKKLAIILFYLSFFKSFLLLNLHQLLFVIGFTSYVQMSYCVQVTTMAKQTIFVNKVTRQVRMQWSGDEVVLSMVKQSSYYCILVENQNQFQLEESSIQRNNDRMKCFVIQDGRNNYYNPLKSMKDAGPNEIGLK